MPCGGHLGYAIGTKITNLVEDHPVIISIMLQFLRLSSFWQEDFQSFNQWEHIIDPGSHVGFPICTKITNLVEDLPMNISAKFWSKSVLWFQRRRLKYEKFTDTDDGRKVMTKAHLAQRARWANKRDTLFYILPILVLTKSSLVLSSCWATLFSSVISVSFFYKIKLVSFITCLY